MSSLRKADEGTETEAEEDETYRNAHGTVMILAWIVFGSMAILFARYGREIQFGSKKNLLGEAIWFQIHRCVACLTTVTTLLGFLFILVQAKATWVESGEGLEFVHSVLGGIVVVGALVQAWMAIFRCHPDGAYRFIYNWLHRITGLLSFFLSIPTIFIIVVYLEIHKTGMIIILSLWSAWVVIIVVIMEIIRIRNKNCSPSEKDEDRRNEFYELNQHSISNNRNKRERTTAPLNNLILILFAFHFIVSLSLSIPLIVLLWT